MTQRTLVGTSPLMSRPSHDKGHTDGSRRRDMVEGPSSPGETARAVREAVPSTTISSAPANDVAATAARADQASKRGKSRRERPDTERGVSSRPHHGEDAPFRNTRARSRSVEPPPVTKVSTRDIARDNGRKPSRKGSEKWRERGELNGIPEGEDQDDVNEGTQPVPSLESDVQPDPELAPRPGQASTSKRVIRETHEDERVVEVLLEDGASECSGVSSGLFSEGDDENVLPPFHDIEVDMEKSLDEDDQETDQALREAAMVQGVRRSEERRQGDVGVEERSSVLEEGEDTVKELHAKMSSTRLARAPRPIIRMQTRSGVIGTRNAQEPTARARSRHG
ncbi:hypothetical protein SCLCIDRAFT_558572 [Scleroderma citrinum Foug A]|uniref:Uncharacterized protein n=1 Tax=Scleroderma citrinum Foug A TaxID=1036808 RepID=A0A0C3D8H1_9AGAM|nr:hypothetical protein SCLCIDRAFT_558572 [Scleroderma citrinum Foug A]